MSQRTWNIASFTPLSIVLELKAVVETLILAALEVLIYPLLTVKHSLLAGTNGVHHDRRAYPHQHRRLHADHRCTAQRPLALPISGRHWGFLTGHRREDEPTADRRGADAPRHAGAAST